MLPRKNSWIPALTLLTLSSAPALADREGHGTFSVEQPNRLIRVAMVGLAEKIPSQNHALMDEMIRDVAFLPAPISRKQLILNIVTSVRFDQDGNPLESRWVRFLPGERAYRDGKELTLNFDAANGTIQFQRKFYEDFASLSDREIQFKESMIRRNILREISHLWGFADRAAIEFADKLIRHLDNSFRDYHSMEHVGAGSTLTAMKDIVIPANWDNVAWRSGNTLCLLRLYFEEPFDRHLPAGSVITISDGSRYRSGARLSKIFPEFPNWSNLVVRSPNHIMGLSCGGKTAYPAIREMRATLDGVFQFDFAPPKVLTEYEQIQGQMLQGGNHYKLYVRYYSTRHGAHVEIEYRYFIGRGLWQIRFDAPGMGNEITQNALLRPGQKLTWDRVLKAIKNHGRYHGDAGVTPYVDSFAEDPGLAALRNESEGSWIHELNELTRDDRVRFPGFEE